MLYVTTEFGPLAYDTSIFPGGEVFSGSSSRTVTSSFTTSRRKNRRRVVGLSRSSRMVSYSGSKN